MGLSEAGHLPRRLRISKQGHVSGVELPPRLFLKTCPQFFLGAPDTVKQGVAGYLESLKDFSGLSPHATYRFLRSLGTQSPWCTTWLDAER